MRRREQGFTLTELMVVVAIIGILVALAGVYMRPNVKPIDVATRMGDLVREASRRAVALGPVRANVALNVTSKKARTRVRADGTKPKPTFVLERLQEDLPATATTAVWIEVLRYTVDNAVTLESYGDGVGSHAGLTRTTDWTTFEVLCYPEGTCQSKSVFFEAVKPGPAHENKSRMSIMPLGGAIVTKTDWN